MGLAHPNLDLLDRHPLKTNRYTGFVVDNDDSKTGTRNYRVKVRVPQLHRGIPIDDLPWSLPQAKGVQNAKNGVGSVNIPPVGSKVFVYFEQDDPHLLYYTHNVTTTDVVEKNKFRNHKNYPHVRGFVDQAGNSLMIDTKDKIVEFIHSSGTKFRIEKDGSITIASAKDSDLTLSSNRNIKIKAKGNVSVGAGSGVSLAAGTNMTMTAKQDMKTVAGRNSYDQTKSTTYGAPSESSSEWAGEDPATPDEPETTEPPPHPDTTYEDTPVS